MHKSQSTFIPGSLTIGRHCLVLDCTTATLNMDANDELSVSSKGRYGHCWCPQHRNCKLPAETPMPTIPLGWLAYLEVVSMAPQAVVPFQAIRAIMLWQGSYLACLLLQLPHILTL